MKVSTESEQLSPQQTYLSPLANLPQLLHLGAPRVLQNNLDFAPIAALDLIWRCKPISHRNSQALQRDENQIRL